MLFADAGGSVQMADEGAAKSKVVEQWFAPILAPAHDAVRTEVLASVHNTEVDAVSESQH